MYGQNMYYPSPAMQTAQQRLQMMEAQYPQYANQMTYTQQPTYQNPSQPMASAAPVLKGRPVSNEEEANAAMIDFDGSLFVFPDKAHGKIYTKQLGLDGNIVFNRYSIDLPSQPKQETLVQSPQIDLSEYAKKSDLEKQISSLTDKVTSLEKRITYQAPNKGGTKV